MSSLLISQSLARATVLKILRMHHRYNLSKSLKNHIFYLFYNQFFLLKFRDSSTYRFPLYATGRENYHFCYFILELKKRQDFISMFTNIFRCRNFFQSPIRTDSMWLEIPIERKVQSNKLDSADLVAEILIIQKKGYYLEDMKAQMPHIDYFLKVKYPQHPCAQIMK